MTTKQQERDALQKIREILETLDADGYVRTAFDGVLDIAETNIENDWACSLKEQVESARAGESDWKEKYGRTLEDLRAANSRIAEIEENLVQAEVTIEDLSRTNQRLSDEVCNGSRELENAQHRIMMLKADLYDYMTEKKEG
jgi:predicted RNase H-like nuclease (RuvC/YqgF family)